MATCDRQMTFVFAIAVLFGVVQSRAVNISNTWMLPEEGFPVFYRYFRDRISWYEADAVCQFHHANLVTADSSSQYDAIRAYLKELDITEKVWIGLSKTSEKPNFVWTNFQPLSGEGHWQEALPTGESQSLCAVMDPAADFLWRPLPCGGPEVAAFICELPIPSWALGPKGCLLTELPSLTVLYIPEQSALELTSDCGLDGTKRIACKGNADREEILRQLTCVISNDDIDEDKSTKTSTSDYYETSTLDENSIISKTPKSWTYNTISADYGMPTRHRRETEDTLSPGSTKSSFKEVPTKELSWQDTHREKTVLTTQHILALNENASPTTATSFVVHLTTDALTTVKSTPTLNIKEANQYLSGSNGSKKEEKENTPKTQNTHLEAAQKDVDSQITTKQHMKFTTPSSKITEMTETNTKKFGLSQSSNKKLEGTSSTVAQEGNAEEYPSAINQGQLFSIVMNGSMYDIMELNETEQEAQKVKSSKYLFTVTTQTVLPVTETNKMQSPKISNKENVSLKKTITKKPIQPTKKYTKDFPKGKHTFTDNKATTEKPIINIQSVDQIEENLTKEFEMMPVISDIAPKLNRTFRKELPAIIDENSGLESGSQFGVPRILNFTVTNSIDSEDEGYQQDQPQQDTNITETIILSEEIEAKTERVLTKINVESKVINNLLSTTTFPEMHNAAIKVDTTPNTLSEVKLMVKINPKAEIDLMPETRIETDKNKKEETSTISVHHPIDPRLYILNQHPDVPKNNDSELLSTAKPHDTTVLPKIAKEEYLPKSLLGDKKSSPETTKQSDVHSETTEAYTEHPFPSDEPKKVNRHRSLHSSKQRKFYPYFFSRMLG